MRDPKYYGIWPCLLLADAVVLIVVHMLAAADISGLYLASYGALVLLTTALAAAPLIRFLVTGWSARYEEFRNRLNNGALIYYLRQFWQPRTDKEPLLKAWPPLDNAGVDAAAEKLFEQIYREHYGRTAFLMPMLLMLAAIIFMANLYMFAQLYKLALPVNNLIVAASIAGAYLFVVSDMVLSVRRRSLNVADVYWYALRMVLAIPIGVAISAAGATGDPSTLQSISAFSVGAFPMDMLLRLIRRLAARNLGANERDQDSDQLIKLEGVTAGIAATLAVEGVNSIEQLIGTDPVLLSIRTGFPFKFVLRLGSQAIVWRYFSQHCASLALLGLAEASAIVHLNEMWDLPADDPGHKQADSVVVNAASQLQASGAAAPNADAIRFNFHEIGAEPYTRFLLAAQKQKVV